MQKLRDYDSYEVGFRVGKYEAYVPLLVPKFRDILRIERALKVALSYYFTQFSVGFRSIRFDRSYPPAIVLSSEFSYQGIDSLACRIVSIITKQFHYGK